MNGIKKAISSDLYTILKRLQHSEHCVLLWVDQICINQDDLVEKESQVKLMGLVYSKAWTTAIWIGEAPDLGAFKALEGMFEATRYRNEMLLDDELGHPSGEDQVAFTRLLEIFDMPWFKRTWVIQEAVLSQRAYILVGTSAISWKDFSSWCDSISTLGILRNVRQQTGRGIFEISQPSIDGTEAAGKMCSSFDAMESFSHKPDMLSILERTRYAQVSNPLDKAYGVLALCENTIMPDYSKAPETLFHELAVHFIRTKTASMDVSRLLSCVDHEPAFNSALPSWAPDWSKPRFTTCLGFSTSSRSYYRSGVRSSTLSFPQLGYVCLLVQNEAALELEAKVFDSIHSMSRVFGSPNLAADSPRFNNECLREAINFVKSRTDPIKHASIFLSLAMSLVAGKDGGGLLKYPTEFTEVLSLLFDKATGQQPCMPGQVYSPRQQKGRLSIANLKRRALGRTFQDVNQAYRAALLNRRLCWSKSGYLGLVPRYAREGDLLCIFMDLHVPFVVREQQDGRYSVIGECYVSDIMDGQLLENDEIPTVRIRLV